MRKTKKKKKGVPCMPDSLPLPCCPSPPFRVMFVSCSCLSVSCRVCVFCVVSLAASRAASRVLSSLLHQQCEVAMRRKLKVVCEGGGGTGEVNMSSESGGHDQHVTSVKPVKPVSRVWVLRGLQIANPCPYPWLPVTSTRDIPYQSGTEIIHSCSSCAEKLYMVLDISVFSIYGSI